MKDYVPGALVAVLVLLVFVWNLFARIPFSLPFWSIASIPFVLLGLSGYYRFKRPSEVRFFELPYYMGLWIVFPIFGTQLTYLGLAAGFPYWDGVYSCWDKALGFDWMAWRGLLDINPVIKEVLRLAYTSSFFQPFVTVLAIVCWAPGYRNGEFLTAILLGLLITIVIATLMPAVGPIATYGLDAHLANFIANLRALDPKPSWYMGIIVFPSFHTIMAIIFVWANRGLPTFWPFVVLNFLMLWAIPTWGNHYLVDMLGGTLVAAIAIWLAPYAQGRFSGRFPSILCV